MELKIAQDTIRAAFDKAGLTDVKIMYSQDPAARYAKSSFANRVTVISAQCVMCDDDNGFDEVVRHEIAHYMAGAKAGHNSTFAKYLGDVEDKERSHKTMEEIKENCCADVSDEEIAAEVATVQPETVAEQEVTVEPEPEVAEVQPEESATATAEEPEAVAESDDAEPEAAEVQTEESAVAEESESESVTEPEPEPELEPASGDVKANTLTGLGSGASSASSEAAAKLREKLKNGSAEAETKVSSDDAPTERSNSREHKLTEIRKVMEANPDDTREEIVQKVLPLELYNETGANYWVGFCFREVKRPYDKAGEQKVADKPAKHKKKAVSTQLVDYFVALITSKFHQNHMIGFTKKDDMTIDNIALVELTTVCAGTNRIDVLSFTADIKVGDGQPEQVKGNINLQDMTVNAAWSE